MGTSDSTACMGSSSSRLVNCSQTPPPLLAGSGVAMSFGSIFASRRHRRRHRPRQLPSCWSSRTHPHIELPRHKAQAKPLLAPENHAQQGLCLRDREQIASALCDPTKRLASGLCRVVGRRRRGCIGTRGTSSSAPL